MTIQTKTIGRMPTDHGPYDPELAYGKKFQCELFGCVWESLHDNNNTAPAVWDGGDIITPNLVDWKKASGDYNAWLMNKDKPASSGTTGDYPYNGMGRVVLKKNMVEGENILTQDAFEDGEGNPLTNTIFVIKYDFVLGEDITIPANCVLEFEGGSILNSNNLQLTFSDTLLSGNVCILCNIYGTIKNSEIYSNWFGFVGDNTTDNSPIFDRLLNVNLENKKIIFVGGSYKFNSTVTINQQNIEIVAFTDRYHGGSCVYFGTLNNITILRFKAKRYHVCGIQFFGNQGHITDYNTIGVHFSQVDDSDLSTETDGTKASLDSKIEKCTFSYLNTGIYAVGNQLTIENCSFNADTVVGVKINSLLGNIDPPLPYYGATTRSVIVRQCGWHSMTRTDQFCIEVLSDRCIGLLIENNHQDCECTFYKGPLIRSLFQNNYLSALNLAAINATVIRKSIISNNTFLSTLGSGNWESSDNEAIKPSQTILANSVENTTIVGNYFDKTAYHHLRFKAKNVTISSNVFRTWCSAGYDRSAFYFHSSSANVTVIGNTFELENDTNNTPRYIMRMENYRNRSIIISNNQIVTKNSAKFNYILNAEGTQDNLNNYPTLYNNVLNEVSINTQVNLGNLRGGSAVLGDVYNGRVIIMDDIGVESVWKSGRWTLPNNYSLARIKGTTAQRPIGIFTKKTGLSANPDSKRYSLYQYYTYKNTSDNKYYLINQMNSDYSLSWVEESTLNANVPVDVPRSGTFANKPTAEYVTNNLYVGFEYFATDLGVPIFVSYIHSDVYAVKWDFCPYNSGCLLNPKFDIGFQYFDTDLNEYIYVKSIDEEGTVTWVDATGTPV